MKLFFQIDFRLKPYVRMTQRGKYVKPEAIEYTASQKLMKMLMTNKMAVSGYDMLPGKTPLKVEIIQVIQGAIHNHDGDNTVKAILDAMTGIAYPDDRWIDSIHFLRFPGSKDMTQIHVEAMVA